MRKVISRQEAAALVHRQQRKVPGLAGAGHDQKEISPSGEIKKPPEGGEEEDHMNHEEKMISMLEEINQRLVSVEVAQENILIPQIQALAEGQKTILDTLAPKSKVEALEEEVELLKSIIKMHTNQINDLKKAQ